MKIIKLEHPYSYNDTIKNNMSSNPSLVKVYRPQCIYCKNLEPNWKIMVNNLKKKYNGNMNIIDLHADVVPYIKPDLTHEIYGYPSIFELSKDGIKMESYEGNRTPQDLLNWVSNTFKKHGIKKKYVNITYKNNKKNKKLVKKNVKKNKKSKKNKNPVKKSNKKK